MGKPPAIGVYIMSSRVWAVCLLLLSPLICLAQDDPVLGKKRGEWLEILKTHKETKFRRAALIALEVYGAKSAGVLEGLFLAIEKDGEPEIRREIALILGRMGPDARGAVETLGESLRKDKSEVVREAAALSLGKIGDSAQTQVVTIAAAMKDAHPGTRAAAAEALKNLGEKAKLVQRN